MTLRHRGLAVAALAVSAWACTSGPPPPDETAQLQDVEAHRAAVDRFFRESKESPIPVDKRSKLLPIQYYPPDPRFSVPADLKLAEDRPVRDMPTSTGTVMKYQMVGVLEFTLHGQALTLGAFAEVGKPISELFVPFVDETAAGETYGGGRYLNLKPRSTGVYTIDFNYAYNPSCAYDER